MKFRKPLAVAAVMAAATGIAIPTLGASGNKFGASTVSFVCKDSVADAVNTGTVTLNGPLNLWPPNHKMVDEPVTAQRDANSTGTSVTLTLTPKVTDAVGGDGGPQHDPDFSTNDSSGDTFVATSSSQDPNSATAGFQVRAERSGKGDGRTYTIQWKVDWGNGNTCDSGDGKDNHAPFVISVPHDMGGGATKP